MEIIGTDKRSRLVYMYIYVGICIYYINYMRFAPFLQCRQRNTSHSSIGCFPFKEQLVVQAMGLHPIQALEEHLYHPTRTWATDGSHWLEKEKRVEIPKKESYWTSRRASFWQYFKIFPKIRARGRWNQKDLKSELKVSTTQYTNIYQYIMVQPVLLAHVNMGGGDSHVRMAMWS